MNQNIHTPQKKFNILLQMSIYPSSWHTLIVMLDSKIFQIVAFKGEKKELISCLSGISLFYYVYIEGNGLGPFPMDPFGTWVVCFLWDKCVCLCMCSWANIYVCV